MNDPKTKEVCDWIANLSASSDKWRIKALRYDDDLANYQALTSALYGALDLEPSSGPAPLPELLDLALNRFAQLDSIAEHFPLWTDLPAAVAERLKNLDRCEEYWEAAQCVLDAMNGSNWTDPPSLRANGLNRATALMRYESVAKILHIGDTCPEKDARGIANLLQSSTVRIAGLEEHASELAGKVAGLDREREELQIKYDLQLRRMPKAPHPWLIRAIEVSGAPEGSDWQVLLEHVGQMKGVCDMYVGNTNRLRERAEQAESGLKVEKADSAKWCEMFHKLGVAMGMPPGDGVDSAADFARKLREEHDRFKAANEELETKSAGHHAVCEEYNERCNKYRERAESAEGNVKEQRAEVERLRDGLDAIRQYGSDTRRGPVQDSDNTMEWQRAGVMEMKNRAVRVLRGDPWKSEVKEGDEAVPASDVGTIDAGPASTGLVKRRDGECEECGENIGCECNARVRLGPCDACEEHECRDPNEFLERMAINGECPAELIFELQDQRDKLQSERSAALKLVSEMEDGMREIDASFERQCDSVDPAVVARHVKGELSRTTAPGFATDAMYYTGTHVCAYRRGEAAEVVGVRMVTPDGMAPRPIFALRFADGVTGEAAVETGGYYKLDSQPDDWHPAVTVGEFELQSVDEDVAVWGTRHLNVKIRLARKSSDGWSTSGGHMHESTRVALLLRVRAMRAKSWPARRKPAVSAAEIDPGLTSTLKSGDDSADGSIDG